MSSGETAAWSAQAARLAAHCAPRLGVVLGSGLGALAERVDDALAIDYSEVPELPVSRVGGHAGRLVAGWLGGAPVVLACGRVHAYEGHSGRALGAHVRLLAQAGVTTLLLTNAAGALNPEFAPGGWMAVRDHINLLAASPLEGGANFIDMSEAYDPELRGLALGRARARGLTMHEGVYAAVRGPQYETPAEVRMLQRLGADAVGMSTVPEVLQARALGMRVAAFSLLSNRAAGLGGAPLDHQEVLDAAAAASAAFSQLLLELSAELG